MKHENPNVERWLNDENFQKFMRQLHTDVYVGLKNGVSEHEVKIAIGLLAHEIIESVNFTPVTPKAKPEAPKVDFESLISPQPPAKWFKFYGVCDTCFKLDAYVFEAVEDENDGYRSYLETIRPARTDNLTFSHIPFATVQIVPVDTGVFVGWELKDKSGHTWLSVGTDNNDDYYPCFVFNYSPKKS